MRRVRDCRPAPNMRAHPADRLSTWPDAIFAEFCVTTFAEGSLFPVVSVPTQVQNRRIMR
jgi:hypothetical protein